MGQFKNRDQMFNVFCADARYLGDGMYSIWAPGGKIYEEDTEALFERFLSRFDRSGNNRYNIDTVRETED